MDNVRVEEPFPLSSKTTFFEIDNLNSGQTIGGTLALADFLVTTTTRNLVMHDYVNGKEVWHFQLFELPLLYRSRTNCRGRTIDTEMLQRLTVTERHLQSCLVCLRFSLGSVRYLRDNEWFGAKHEQ